MDERTVNTEMLISWLKANGPNGELKLAEKSRVSYHTIARIRSGYVPRKDITRIALASAMGVAVDKFFPLVRAKGKDKAS